MFNLHFIKNVVCAFQELRKTLRDIAVSIYYFENIFDVCEYDIENLMIVKVKNRQIHYHLGLVHNELAYLIINLDV